MENIGRLKVAKLNAFLFKDQNCKDFGLETLYIFTFLTGRQEYAVTS
jgi:hypothetical protein